MVKRKLMPIPKRKYGHWQSTFSASTLSLRIGLCSIFYRKGYDYGLWLLVIGQLFLFGYKDDFMRKLRILSYVKEKNTIIL